jgi:hypothetical protein
LRFKTGIVPVIHIRHNQPVTDPVEQQYTH